METPKKTIEVPETLMPLLKQVDEDLAKKDDSFDSFLSELSKPVADTVRKETKAFLSDIKAAAGKVTSAIVHLWKVYTALGQGEGMTEKAHADMFAKYGNTLVAEGHVTKGTLYTLTQKIKVFEHLSLPDPARSAIMAYSGGDSIIVRRALSVDEVKLWKSENPTLKAPKSVYEPSPYFTQACSIIEHPTKWTPENADHWAGRTIRLAAKIRGKARSGGADTAEGSADDAKALRFTNAVDKLQVFIAGESTENGIKGQIILQNKNDERTMIFDAASVLFKAFCQRLPLAELENMYEAIDQIFTDRKDALVEAAKKNNKTPKAA